VFFLLSKLLDVVFSPLAWAFVLVAVGVPWRSDARPWSRWRRACVVVGLVELYVFALEPTALTLARALEASAPQTMRPGATYDAVVLLGGMVDEWTTADRRVPAYNENVERLLSTFDLLRTGRARVVVISGGAQDPALGRAAEAYVLADQLAAWGIDAQRLVVEAGSRNTRENAVNTAQIVRARGFHRVLLVTSAAHMVRAQGCFNAVGLAVDTLPVDWSTPRTGRPPFTPLPRATALASSTEALREFAGRLVYRVRGFTRPAP
jgi:uncharacterized SAM-binding protein YcdF (DUF218 family)